MFELPGTGLGLGTTFHFEPFQLSASVFSPDTPVAWQFVALAQEMASSGASVAPDGAGTVTSDHFVPFQRSAVGRVAVCELLL
jgi:hypothetical protein